MVLAPVDAMTIAGRSGTCCACQLGAADRAARSVTAMFTPATRTRRSGLGAHDQIVDLHVVRPPEFALM